MNLLLHNFLHSDSFLLFLSIGIFIGYVKALWMFIRNFIILYKNHKSNKSGKLGIANTRVQELEEQLALEKGKAEELATQLSEANTKLENLPVSNQQYKLHSDLLVGDRVNRTYKLPIKLVESIADDAEKSGETVLDLVTMRLATSKEKTIMSDTKSGS